MKGLFALLKDTFYNCIVSVIFVVQENKNPTRHWLLEGSSN